MGTQKNHLAEELVQVCTTRSGLEWPMDFSFVNISSFARNKKHHLTDEPRARPTLGGAPSKELRRRGVSSLRGSTRHHEVNLRRSRCKLMCVLRWGNSYTTRSSPRTKAVFNERSEFDEDSWKKVFTLSPRLRLVGNKKRLDRTSCKAITHLHIICDLISCCPWPTSHFHKGTGMRPCA